MVLAVFGFGTRGVSVLVAALMPTVETATTAIT